MEDNERIERLEQELRDLKNKGQTIYINNGASASSSAAASASSSAVAKVSRGCLWFIIALIGFMVICGVVGTSIDNHPTPVKTPPHIQQSK